MSKTPAFIINYNRLSLPARMADYLADCPGVYPVIVDNNSTYPPLLAYYETTTHRVKRLKSNWCATAVWYCEILDEYNIHERYIVTDPDLILDGIPRDFLHLLHLGLDRYPWADKSGFSLEIDDLPDTPIGRAARKHEASAWLRRLDGQFYRSMIDTTFCLVRKIHGHPAVRTARPYTAKHAPWYYTSEDSIPADELYYMQTASPKSSYWTKLIAAEFGVSHEV